MSDTLLPKDYVSSGDKIIPSESFQRNQTFLQEQLDHRCIIVASVTPTKVASLKSRKNLLYKFISVWETYEEEIIEAIQADICLQDDEEGGFVLQGQLEYGALLQEAIGLCQNVCHCKYQRKLEKRRNRQFSSRSSSISSSSISTASSSATLKMTSSRSSLVMQNRNSMSSVSSFSTDRQDTEMDDINSSDPTARILLGAWEHPMVLLAQPLLYAISEGTYCLVRVAPQGAALQCIKLLNKILTETLEGTKYVQHYGVSLSNSAVSQLVQRLAWSTTTTENDTNHDPFVSMNISVKIPVFVDQGLSRQALVKCVRRIVCDKSQCSGQTLYAPDYVVVHNNISEEFTHVLLAEIKERWQQDGSVINDYHLKRLYKLLRKRGGDIIHGIQQVEAIIESKGAQRSDIPLIVLKNPPLSSSMMRKDIYGPILPILTVSSMKEGVKLVKEVNKNIGGHVCLSNACYVFSQKDSVEQGIVNSMVGPSFMKDHLYLSKAAILNTAQCGDNEDASFLSFFEDDKEESQENAAFKKPGRKIDSSSLRGCISLLQRVLSSFCSSNTNLLITLAIVFVVFLEIKRSSTFYVTVIFALHQGISKGNGRNYIYDRL